MLKLLIADDEKIFRDTICTLINWEELDIKLVGTAKDGIEAYNMILDKYPDIIITDIKMPGLSGLELIQKIHDVNEDTQFIILSGYSDFEYAKTAMKYGVRHYLLKPCNESQIISSIKDVQESIQKKYSRLYNETVTTAATYPAAYKEIEMSVAQLFSTNPEENQTACEHLINAISSVQDFQVLKQLTTHLVLQFLSNSFTITMLDATSFLLDLDQTDNIALFRSKLIDKIREISMRHLQSQSIKSSSEISERIHRYVQANLSNPNLSLKWIAENELYMNVDYLSKKFVKETGIKFSSYLNETRILAAKELLAHSGTEKIQNIADSVGFGNNPQYFNQVFKKYTGMTPKGYISQMQENKLN